jgi:hypothetical protein
VKKAKKPKRTDSQRVKAATKLVKKLRLQIKTLDRELASWRTKKTC